MNVGNESFERVEHFRQLGTTLTNQNFCREEIDTRLKLGNDYCRWLQNFLS